MIKTTNELHDYLAADRYALGIERSRPNYFGDEIWKFEIALRKHEFYHNAGSRVRKYYWKWQHHRLGVKLGFSIPINVCDKGLSLAHIGPVIINDGAKIGCYCRIHAGVNIGTAAGFVDKAPTIGDRVYIGPGAKLFGDISIGDDVAIGANAVVNKSFEGNVSIGGVPARVISNKNSKDLVRVPRESEDSND